jgi:hypothetical protein
MIKTLHITGAAAVVLAVVVVASVLGYLRPASFMHVSAGTRGEKQIEKILSGSSAVERFKELHAGKVPSGEDTTPPLVKQAGLFADIINPPASVGTPPKLPSQMPPKPSVKPPVAVSGKFGLVGTSYSSSDPKTSFAYIRLPDNTYQWVGQGSEIGHGTIKEIRRGSITYWDGTRNVEMPVEAMPETSSLLETGRASATPGASQPQPTVGGNAPSGPVKPFAASNRPTAPGIPSPSAQISKEEQENLSQLGNRLKAGTGADAAGRDATANKLISEFKSARGNPPESEKLGNPGEPSNENANAAKDSLKGGARSMFKTKLSRPRSMEK